MSARGGLIQLFGYEESKGTRASSRSAGSDPPARSSAHQAGRSKSCNEVRYALHAPNPWTGVTVEMHGPPDADDKAVPEDLSGYKTLSLQVYATGIEILRPRRSASRAARIRLCMAGDDVPGAAGLQHA